MSVCPSFFYYSKYKLQASKSVKFGFIRIRVVSLKYPRSNRLLRVLIGDGNYCSLAWFLRFWLINMSVCPSIFYCSKYKLQALTIWLWKNSCYVFELSEKLSALDSANWWSKFLFTSLILQNFNNTNKFQQKNTETREQTDTNYNAIYIANDN